MLCYYLLSNMVNKNITFHSILKSQKKKYKGDQKKSTIQTKITKKKKISNKDISLLSCDVHKMKIDDIDLSNKQPFTEKKSSIYYKNKMVVIPLLLDNKNTNYYSCLKNVEYGMYSFLMILQKNKNVKMWDEQEVNHETMHQYYPEIETSNVNNIIFRILDNGLKMYLIILNKYIHNIKHQICNINDTYEWVQFNGFININQLDQKETIINYLMRMYIQKYKYNILSIQIKIDNNYQISLYDIISTLSM